MAILTALETRAGLELTGAYVRVQSLQIDDSKATLRYVPVAWVNEAAFQAGKPAVDILDEQTAPFALDSGLNPFEHAYAHLTVAVFPEAEDTAPVRPEVQAYRATLLALLSDAEA